ncbi:MAG: hypothetical protein KJ574_04255 [Nanoarchaeota archaeon]|nr:hypothetical protein [Nanoarchaeota archaeon]
MAKKDKLTPINQTNSYSTFSGPAKAALGLAAGLAAAVTLSPNDAYAKQTPQNHAPTCNVAAEVELQDGQAIIDLQEACFDTDGDSLSYTTNSPNASIYDDSKLKITAPGPVIVTVADGHGGSTPVSITGRAPQPAMGMSLDDILSGGDVVVEETQAPAAPIVTVEPADVSPAAPTDGGLVEGTVTDFQPPEPAVPTAPATQPSGSHVSGTFDMGTIMHGDGPHIIINPNWVGGSLAVNNWELRLRGIGGYLSPDSPGYDSSVWNAGFAAGMTAPLSVAGQLDLDIAYLHNEGTFDAHAPLDAYENLVPNIAQSSNSFGAILRWLLGEKGRFGTFRAEVGYNGSHSNKDQTIVDPETSTVDEGPTIESPAPGVTITQEMHQDISHTQTNIYDGEESEDNLGFLASYMSPAIPAWGSLYLGIGGGFELHKFNAGANHTFIDQVDITGYTRVTIETPDGSDSDEQPIDIHETSTSTTDEPNINEDRTSGFLDLMARFYKPGMLIEGLDARVSGMMRIHLDDNMADDQERIEGALSMLWETPYLNAAGNYWRVNRSDSGSVFLIGAGTPGDLIETYFQIMTQNVFGFQPQEIKDMQLQLANARLMNGLDGVFVGYSGSSGEYQEDRVYLGWGFPQVAVVAQYAHPTNEISAGLTIKDSVLKIGSLTLAGGRSDVEDYKVQLLFTAHFGDDGQE